MKYSIIETMVKRFHSLNDADVSKADISFDEWDKRRSQVNAMADELVRALRGSEQLATRIRGILGPRNDDSRSVLDLIDDLCEENDRLRAAACAVVPEGYAIVPVKPSPEMLAACRVAGKTRVWSDMMAARPEVPWACKSDEGGL